MFMYVYVYVYAGLSCLSVPSEMLNCIFFKCCHQNGALLEHNGEKKCSNELFSNNSSLRGFQPPQVFCWSQGNGLLKYNPGNII